MSQNIVSANAAALPIVSVRALCAIAMLIGASLVYVTGFAQSDVVHNAAHDTRHSLAFPCH